MAITGSQKALLYAQSGVARSGATRSGYTSGAVFVSIGGTHVAFGRLAGTLASKIGTLIGSISIEDNLDEAPNRCTFRVTNWVPQIGYDVLVTLGSKNTLQRLFAGHVVDVAQSYLSKPANLVSDVAAVDYTWLLGFVLVTKRYSNQSATAIAQDLIGTYGAANGFTAANVTENLPVVDEFTVTDEPLPECLTRLARRIGAYWYVDYQKDVHLFFNDVSSSGVPVDLTPTHRSLADVTAANDGSQVLTRVYVEGRGSTVLAPVGLGETRIPLETVDMFEVAADVFAKVSFQGSDGGAQHLTFAGVVPGGAGSLVGPGIGPSAGPTLTAQAGAGVTSGLHTYAVTFVTASGESLTSPIATITTGLVADPTVAPGPLTQTPTSSPNGSFIPIGRTVSFTYTYGTTPTPDYTTGQTLQSPPSASIVTVSNQDNLNPAMSAPIQIPVPYSTDPRVKWVYVWARDAVVTGANYTLFKNNLPNHVEGGTLYLTSAGGSIANLNPAPTTNTTAANQIAVSDIPIGGSAVTQRKLYRSAAGGGQLKLLTTLANNTATTYLDTAADAALGANAPSTDTSGLQQPAGQVVAGATAMPVAGPGAFQASGGWAIIGNGDQVIRYTTVTGATLTGIPTTGVGAIVATISYNSTVTAAPMLTGIPASGPRALTTRALVAGDELYTVVQADDTTRQSQLSASISGSTGIREEWVQDRRLSVTEARARGQATLLARPLFTRSLSYRCRDVRTASGQSITVNLPAPTNVSGVYKIQQVRIDNFRPRPTQYPTYTVQASSTRYSFEDLLRRVKSKE